MIYTLGINRMFESDSFKTGSLSHCIELIKSHDIIGLDTETEGFFNFVNKIVCLQLSFKSDKGSDQYFIEVRGTDFLTYLKPYLEDKIILGQNLKFDYKFLKFHGIELNRIYDTMLAECCLTNGLLDRQLSLEALAMNYCGIKLNKSVRNQFVNLDSSPFTEAQIVYGVGDVTCLTEIKEKQTLKIKELDIFNWVKNEFQACLALGDIEYNGMGFDAVKWSELSKKAKFNVKDYTDELDEYVRQDNRLSKFVSNKVQGNLFAGIEEGYEHGRDVNILWSSPAQCDKVFEALGLKLDSTSERFLSKYQTQYPIIKKFIDYKKQAKLVTTYGEKFLKYINPNTQRIHTSFWQVLDTSRVSSGSKRDNTPNMQNIPAKIEYRNCFICRPGFKMCSVDFSGQELRLVAEGSQEPLWVDAFNKGEDLHSNVASMVFGIPLEQVRDKPAFLRGKSYRDAAKTVNFGLVYGMSKFKLADTLDISVDDADGIIKLSLFLEYINSFNRLYCS